MKELVFLLEEESAKSMLEGLVPRVLSPNYTTRYIVFEGKQDLEKQLVRRILMYQNKHAKFIILRDQDSHPDCKKVKAKIASLCAEAKRPDAVVRIACRELESFYLADLVAVEKGLEIKGISKEQNKKKYRNPDYLVSPSLELKRLTRERYQKVSGSRAIGPYLDIENERSASFFHLVKGIQRASI